MNSGIAFKYSRRSLASAPQKVITAKTWAIGTFADSLTVRMVISIEAGETFEK